VLDLTTAINSTEPAHDNACKLRRILNSIPGETPGLDTLVAGIELSKNEGWPATRPAAILTANGLPVSPSQITTHRRRECVCYRTAA
jgi:hypothetical protein